MSASLESGDLGAQMQELHREIISNSPIYKFLLQDVGSRSPLDLASLHPIWEILGLTIGLLSLPSSQLTIHSVSPGIVIAHLPLTGNLLNGRKVLHGSVSATIIDWIGGIVIASTGSANRGVSVDIHVTYSGAAKEGDLLIIEGKSRKVGRNLAFIGVEIRARKAGSDGEEKIVVSGSHTKYVG
ncbi:hypothetical protein HWV62_9982 [Athelia sp. TMB]|nr:hypothetical protein HWV62_9982 [Athelia sp. TMB]